MNKIQTEYHLPLGMMGDVIYEVNEPHPSVRVKELLPERWRSFDEAINFYTQVIDGIKELKEKYDG